MWGGTAGPRTPGSWATDRATGAGAGGSIFARLKLEAVDAIVRMHVAVRDGSAEVPRIREPGDDEHGRGLRIVEALSTAWGSTPTRDGKVVWATLRPRR